MLRTLSFYLLLSLSFTLIASANSSEDEIQKALEGISQIKVMPSSITPSKKVVSEVKVVESVVVADVKKETSTPQPLTKENSTLTVKDKKIVKKKLHKKRIHKKRVHKKRVHRKKIVKKHYKKIDVSELKDVQTLGVVSTSKPFILK